jgi:outer membrane protein
MKMNIQKYAFGLLFLLLIPQILPAQDALSLTGAIQIALDKNYDIRLIKGDQQIAELRNRWGTAGRYPTVSFSGNSMNQRNNNEQDDYTQNNLSGGVSLNWILFNGFAVNISKARLGNLEELSAGNTAVVVEGTLQSVILGYYKVLLARKQLDVLESVMKLSEDRYNYEKTKQEIGSSVTFDVLQAQNAFLVDKANYMSQQVAYRSAVRDLNYLMGVEAQKTWKLTDKFEPDTKAYQLGDLEEKMLSENSTLKNQFLNQSLLEHEVALARAGYYPKLSLSSGIDGTHNRMNYDAQGERTSNSWSYYGNLTLSYNLYNGGVRHRALQIAEINQDLGQIDVESLKHRLVNQLLNLYEYYNVRNELMTVADEALDAARLNMQIAGEKFRNGAINSFNYRDVQLIYANAALRQLQAIYNLIESNVSLMRITGGIISEYGKAADNQSN